MCTVLADPAHPPGSSPLFLAQPLFCFNITDSAYCESKRCVSSSRFSIMVAGSSMSFILPKNISSVSNCQFFFEIGSSSSKLGFLALGLG